MRFARPLIAPALDAVTEVDGQKNGDADVRSQEGAGGPIRWPEYGEAVDEQEEREANNQDVRTVWLDLGAVRKLVGNVLCHAGLAEAEVDDATANP